MATQAQGCELVNGHLDVSQYNLLYNRNETEMLEQIRQLLGENNKLKEAMKQKSQEMKERLEELLKRGEQGRGELPEFRQRALELSKENELLKKEIQHLKEKHLHTQSEEESLKHQKAQIVRLQTEKADLVGIISELQVKLSSYGSEDSFVEIRFAGKETEAEVKERKAEGDPSDPEMITYRTTSTNEESYGKESEELAVSKLLHSLREESEKVERFQRELANANDRLANLENKSSHYIHKETETDPIVEQNDEDRQAAELLNKEVEMLKQKVEVLNKELYETNEKLNEAQKIKNNLQDRYLSLDKKLADNQVEVDERQTLLYSVQTLELQVESLKSEIRMEQSKTKEQKRLMLALQESSDKQKCDYELLVKAEAEKVPIAQFTQLLGKLNACEKALAKKQLEIDELKEEVGKHKEDAETMSVLKAQIELYCSDFHAEREARQTIHQEKEDLATQLALMLDENESLKGRQSIEQLQRRHVPSSEGPHLQPRGAQNLEQLSVHMCPKCEKVVPDMDTLQIHVMECIT
ncbi:PREDICTED: optineurin [Nanorana parkeri]|uniref:optineurin n=1 Tax=Nanorana parkeri TaxID=125878 RepID=UPI000853F107|nr:PREDICTED: optineurin [Nanorana parkeri]